jgi:hypothetical protein
MARHIPGSISAEKFNHISLKVPDQNLAAHIALIVALAILLVA